MSLNTIIKMKALLPTFFRPVGYIVLLICLFLPFLLVMWNIIDDSNLLFFKEANKLLMMIGALMILLAANKNETEEVGKIRVKSIRYAVFLTIVFLFGGMLYRLYTNSIDAVDSSSFLIFLIINVLCLEFGIKKAAVDKIFKR